MDIFLIAAALILAAMCAGAALIDKKKYVNLSKVLIAVCVIPFIALAVFVTAFLIAFSSPDNDLYITVVIILGVFVAVAFCCALWGLLKKKWVYIPLCSVLLVCIGVMVGYSLYQNHIENLPTVGENENLLKAYMPYRDDSKVAQLDEVPDLKIKYNIPRMDGATALYPVYSAFANAVYDEEVVNDQNMKSFGENQFVKCSTTTGAYEKIVTGETDIVFAAEPSEEQKQFAKDSGVELIYTPIGREAFVFFVNSKNPIEDVSIEQIQGIYSGEITEWEELGIKRMGKIKAFQRDEGSGSQSALKRIMAGKNLMQPLEEEVIDGMGGIISRTADYKNFKNAIGYSFRFYSTEMVKNNQIRLLSINGVEPTVENIENGTYPVASYFYAVTRSDASENTKKLLEWIQSEQGQKLIELTGYTPLK